ncbi:MAG: hypothetical protein MHM6MM_006339 [Cercozoa sp. M6MM]
MPLSDADTLEQALTQAERHLEEQRLRTQQQMKSEATETIFLPQTTVLHGVHHPVRPAALRDITEYPDPRLKSDTEHSPSAIAVPTPRRRSKAAAAKATKATEAAKKQLCASRIALKEAHNLLAEERKKTHEKISLLQRRINEDEKRDFSRMQTINELNKQIADLQLGYATKDDDCVRLKNHLDEMKETRRTREQTIETLNERLAEQRKHNDASAAEIERLKAALQKSSEATTEAKRTVSALQQRIADVEGEALELNRRAIAAFDAEKAATADRAHVQRALEKTVTEQKKMREMYEKQIEQLQQKHDLSIEAERELADRRSRCADQSQQQQRLDLSNQYRKMQQQMARLHALIRKMSGATSRIFSMPLSESPSSASATVMSRSRVENLITNNNTSVMSKVDSSIDLDAAIESLDTVVTKQLEQLPVVVDAFSQCTAQMEDKWQQHVDKLQSLLQEQNDFMDSLDSRLRHVQSSVLHREKAASARPVTLRGEETLKSATFNLSPNNNRRFSSAV